MHENDPFDIFPEFSKVVHILAVIPATSCSAERSFSALRRLKTYLRSTLGQQRVSNIADTLLHMPTLLSAMTWTASLISSAVEMKETAISFKFLSVFNSYVDSYIKTKIHFICRPLLVHRMTLVSFRFMVHSPPPRPPGKKMPVRLCLSGPQG